MSLGDALELLIHRVKELKYPAHKLVENIVYTYASLVARSERRKEDVGESKVN